MSQENVEIVRGVFDNTSARNFEAVMDAYADDVVLVLHGSLATVNGPGAIGKEAVGEWFAEWFRAFKRDYHFTIEELREIGDQEVLIVATHHGTGRMSGVPLSQPAAWIYTLRVGKIVRCDAYRDKATALEAVGLRE